MSDIPINELSSINVEPEADDTNLNRDLFEETKSQILKRQEETRGKLALYLLFGLGGTLIGVGIYIFFSTDDAMTKRELITLIWTSEVTLVSGALGFYFGRGSN